MRATAALGLTAFLLTSCATDNKVTSTVPQAEQRLRKRQCDTLEASFRPSRDQRGHIELFGVSIGGRSATENRNSATGEYLFALNQMLQSCRDWQRYEISPQQFRVAQAELARAAQGPLKDAAAQQLLRKIASAFENAEHGGEASQDEIAQRLTELEKILARPPADLDAWTGALQAFDLRFDRVDKRVEYLEHLVARSSAGNHCLTPTQWSLLFGKGASLPDTDRLAAVIHEIRTRLSSFPGGHLIVIGFADRSGDYTANLSLARKRAAEVGKALVAAGIAVDFQAAEGMTGRLGDNQASNRAVVVSLSC